MYPYSFEMNSTIEEYNTVLRHLAYEHEIRVFELSHSEKDFLDGVHLNRTGIENFSNQISGYILKDKGIEIV
jgi:hypothetical protein